MINRVRKSCTAALLAFAKIILEHSVIESAKEILNQIIKTYPQTKAAEEARTLLSELE